MPSFSVCMSVYHKDKAEDFKSALDSVINQTFPPTELVIVVDGPVPFEIENVLSELCVQALDIKIIRLAQNQGHAVARQTGLEHATYDLVAIMDSDDIAVPVRFEKQVKKFLQDKTLSVLGGQICEFNEQVDNLIGIRNVPVEHNEITTYLRSRCPMNQMTVMMKKADVLAVGGYLHWFCNEDYYLWIRMFKAGYKFANLDECLVYVRVNLALYSRRGGYNYFKSEASLQKYMLDNNIIGMYKYLVNIGVRFIVQVILPNRVRGYIYSTFFRKSNSAS
ncbi:glycosyltransferase [Bacteroides sp. 51]|nr:glycosyltransferase [Bacteroides sp. 51]